MEPFEYRGNTYRATATAHAFTVFVEDVPVMTLTPHTAVDCLIPHKDDPLCYDTVEDTDTGIAAVTVSQDGDSATVSYRTASTAWAEKTVSFVCTPAGITAHCTVQGHGRIGEIRFFGGKSEHDPLGGSSYEFGSYIVPQTDFFSHEKRCHPAIEPYRSYFEMLCPPPYVFAFRTPGIAPCLCAGLTGQAGDWNFMKFDYGTRRTRTRTAFYLSTDFEGHRAVDGMFRTPDIHLFVVDGVGTADAVACTAAAAYADLCRSLGAAAGIPPVQPRKTPMPRFHYGPILCGWREQAVFAHGGEPDEQATEDNYRDFVARAKAHGIHPRVLIIDDKWQKEYGSARPDPEKWHDMRAFCADMKKLGISTVLWYKLWAGQGLAPDAVIAQSDPTPYGTGAYNEVPYCDPSSPAWQAHIKELMHYLLSDDAGCIGADGLKLDFAFMMPRGRRARAQSGQYGTELLLLQMQKLVEAARAAKPCCLINASPCHPLFEGLVDQCRLHDYDDAMRDYCEEMTFRRALFHSALPNALIDPDSPCYGSHRATMRAIRFQPSLGIPDLYRIAPDEGFAFTEEDFATIREVFAAYEEAIGKQI